MQTTRTSKKLSSFLLLHLNLNIRAFNYFSLHLDFGISLLNHLLSFCKLGIYICMDEMYLNMQFDFKLLKYIQDLGSNQTQPNLLIVITYILNYFWISFSKYQYTHIRSGFVIHNFAGCKAKILGFVTHGLVLCAKHAKFFFLFFKRSLKYILSACLF